MNTRKPGIDLLRCLALLFVVIFHAFLNNGYYSEPQKGPLMFLFGSLRWLSVSCIGLFLMLTGYLLCHQTCIRSCWLRAVPILIGYLIAAAISIPIRHFCFGDRQTLTVWLTRLLNFSAVYYGWYVKMYLGLLLLLPFLNRLLQSLSHRQVLALTGALLFLTALPGATPLPVITDYWRSLYPLTYWVIGALIRRTNWSLPPLFGILGALAVSTLLGCATVLSTDGTLSDALTWEFADLWICVIALLLFLSLHDLRIGPKTSRVLRFAAGGCYGGYLLSHLLDGWCYRLVPQWHTPAHYLPLFFLITLPICLVCICVGRILERAAGLCRIKEAP